MDAKPQRPARSIRIREDENMPPALPANKTIHQRNKSSPALSTILGGGGLKATAKRTAFGEISNTVNITRPSKDDSSIPIKTGLQLGAKSNPVLQERKSAAFLRPAQRPLSVSSLRGLLTGSNNVTQTDVNIRPSTAESVPAQPANLRRLLTKRNTTVFKDGHLDTVQEHVFPKKHSAATITGFTNTVYPQAARPAESLPEAQLSLPAPAKKADPSADPLEDLPVLSTETILPVISDVSLDVPLPSSESNCEASASVEQVPPTELQVPILTQIENLLPAAPKPVESTLVSMKEPEEHDMPIVGTIAPTQAIPPLLANYSHLPSQAEGEEYWDDEEEDAYEEEGYVTARSYRSKGENTTGGVTTVLFPQMNQRARREISEAKKLVEATRTPEEIEDECYDTSMVAEYGDEIFDYMKQLEVKMLPNAHYMDNQHEIQWSMRAVLMDWLVQVHHRFNLLPETLFLCVNYIDRFLSCKVVSLGKLQLVGATAIFIAAKYEEINCPSVQEIVYMVDGGYTIDEILKAERFMLTMLQFELGWPGPMSFLRRISKADDYDLETRTLAKYFLEVTIMDERFIGSPPSYAAAASHCLARLMLRKGTWTQHHVYYSNYTYSQLKPILALLLECCEDPRKHHAAVHNKYLDKRYKRASGFVDTEMQRGFQLPHTPIIKEVIQTPMLSYFDIPHPAHFRM